MHVSVYRQAKRMGEQLYETRVEQQRGQSE